MTDRKFSFPTSLYPTSPFNDFSKLNCRRLSNVSDAVSRKLSSTIGWKLAPIPTQQIVTQGYCLCSQYVKRRLKRSGVFKRKLALQRIRSILGTFANISDQSTEVHNLSVVREVFPAVVVLGDELERMHPRLYNNIGRQICRLQDGNFQTPHTLQLLITAIAKDLFRSDITWSKIVSLFAFTGGIAVDCVRQGHAEFLPKIMQNVVEVIEEDLVSWINDNGGWMGLNNYVRPVNSHLNILEWIIIIIGGFFSIGAIFLLLRIIFLQMIPNIYQNMFDLI